MHLKVTCSLSLQICGDKSCGNKNRTGKRALILKSIARTNFALSLTHVHLTTLSRSPINMHFCAVFLSKVLSLWTKNSANFKLRAAIPALSFLRKPLLLAPKFRSNYLIYTCPSKSLRFQTYLSTF